MSVTILLKGGPTFGEFQFAFGGQPFGGPGVPDGIPSAEAFTAPTLRQRLSVASTPSAEAFNGPTLRSSNSFLGVPSIASLEAFSSPTLRARIDLSGVVSSEVVNVPAAGFVIPRQPQARFAVKPVAAGRLSRTATPLGLLVVKQPPAGKLSRRS